MIVLDTNVVLEQMKIDSEPRVQAWLDNQNDADVWLTVITAAELQSGVEKLFPGEKRISLQAQVSAILDEDFIDRILPFDLDAALVYAEIAGRRLRSQRRIHTMDYQMAAIARVYGASVATRNIRDFEGLGIDLIDPWAA
jgi:predicted nucleic acid-binding protein